MDGIMPKSGFYKVSPTPKPRQTQSDKWKKRPCVMRYRAFADKVRDLGINLEPGACVTFHVSMPKSWPEKKKEKMNGQAHLQKPDLSNLLKALEDAAHVDDSHLWDYSGLRKIWAHEGAILVTYPGREVGP